MTVDDLNDLPLGLARIVLERCCGAKVWLERVCAGRPYLNRKRFLAASERAWRRLGPEDWREAFAHHPRIGDLASLRRRYAATAAWAGEEQRGAAHASEAALAALAEGNRAYEEKFGYIFIVCATGKSAEEMLALLEARLENEPDVELKIAAEEQMKITRLRLEKLLSDSP